MVKLYLFSMMIYHLVQNVNSVHKRLVSQQGHWSPMSDWISPLARIHYIPLVYSVELGIG